MSVSLMEAFTVLKAISEERKVAKKALISVYSIEGFLRF